MAALLETCDVLAEDSNSARETTSGRDVSYSHFLMMKLRRRNP
jgi:hypothetical protein